MTSLFYRLIVKDIVSTAHMEKSLNDDKNLYKKWLIMAFETHWLQAVWNCWLDKCIKRVRIGLEVNVASGVFWRNLRT